MIKRICATSDSISLFFVRVALGGVMLPHGLQKTFGMFGGGGFEGTIKGFTEGMGIPWIFALLAILAESAGALGLIVGLFTRVAAIGVGSVMAVAMFVAHLDNGFFMNWKGNQAGEGFEFHLLAIGMALALIAGGAGKWSLDRKLFGGCCSHKH